MYEIRTVNLLRRPVVVQFN